MKYIVLSFDDGLSDFKVNALPILEKFNIKATLNIISGFSDNTYKTKFNYLTIDEIKNLEKQGYEIAIHSDDHSKNIEFKSFVDCKNKLSSWLSCQKFGLIIPFSQKISSEMVDKFNESNYLYFADYHRIPHKKSFRLMILKMINKFIKRGKIAKMIQYSNYFYPLSVSKKQCYSFIRLPAKITDDPKDIVKTIKLMKRNQCLTIVFHSILKCKDDDCDWPEGAWTAEQLYNLLNTLSKMKKIKILRQKDLVDE